MPTLIIHMCLFVCVFLSQHLHANSLTAEMALEHSIDLSSQDLLALLNRDEGDQAWDFTTTLVKKLKSDAFLGLPCAKETAGEIKKKIREILSQDINLKEEDRAGFRRFIEHVDELDKQGFPYLDSVAMTFIFTELLQFYYYKSGVPVLECDSNKEVDLSVSLQDLYLSLRESHTKKKAEPQKKIGGRFCEWAPPRYKEALDVLYDIKNKKIFWPVFADFTIDDFNLIYFLPIAPMSLILTSSEHHDGHGYEWVIFYLS